MPESLVGHLRYAEDLFRVQTELWGRYHVEDTENFYQRAAEWAVSQDPGRTGEGALDLDGQVEGGPGGEEVDVDVPFAIIEDVPLFFFGF